jgi:anti-sigma B factor antagonist
MPGGADDSFSVSVEAGSPAVARLTGELDLATASVLESCLRDVPGSVVLDCHALRFIDSSGLSVIVAAHRRREQTGDRLSIRGLSAALRQTFELTGLHHELHLERPDDH